MTSVGGTSLAIGPRNNWEWEIPWGMLIDPLAASGLSWTYAPPSPYNADTYDGSSGGGVSTAYTQLAPEPPPGHGTCVARRAHPNRMMRRLVRRAHPNRMMRRAAPAQILPPWALTRLLLVVRR